MSRERQGHPEEARKRRRKFQEARIAEERLGSIRIVESLIVPRVPSGPSKKLNVMIAGVLGLFVGVFAAFFKNYMERSRCLGIGIDDENFGFWI